MKQTRRECLAAIGGSAILTGLSPLARAVHAAGQVAPHVTTNTYPWLTFARRARKVIQLHTDELLADIAGAGITGYEPIVTNLAEFSGLEERLQKHELEMRSLYVNSTLHDPKQAKESVGGVLAIAKAARGLGVRIIVTNPSPIRWGGPEDKDDAQLRLQANLLTAWARNCGGRKWCWPITTTTPSYDRADASFIIC